MHKRINEDLIAPCGINCGVCKYYLAKVMGSHKSKSTGCIGCLPKNKVCTYKEGCEPLKMRVVRFCFECTHF
jgi:hypothetical protein